MFASAIERRQNVINRNHFITNIHPVG